MQKNVWSRVRKTRTAVNRSTTLRPARGRCRHNHRRGQGGIQILCAFDIDYDATTSLRTRRRRILPTDTQIPGHTIPHRSPKLRDPNHFHHHRKRLPMNKKHCIRFRVVDELTCAGRINGADSNPCRRILLFPIAERIIPPLVYDTTNSPRTRRRRILPTDTQIPGHTIPHQSQKLRVGWQPKNKADDLDEITARFSYSNLP